MLGVIVIKKWEEEVSNFGASAVKRLTDMLASCGNIDPSLSCSVVVSVHSCLVQLLSAMRKHPMMKLPADKGRERALGHYVWLEKNYVEKKNTSSLLLDHQCACNIAPSVCIRTYLATIFFIFFNLRVSGTTFLAGPHSIPGGNIQNSFLLRENGTQAQSKLLDSC